MEQNLGTVLRKARASRNLTIREAGELLGMAPGYISEIETGRKVPDKEETLGTFARVYGLNTLELRLLASLKHEKGLDEFDLNDDRLKVARKILTAGLTADLLKKLDILADGGEE